MIKLENIEKRYDIDGKFFRVLKNIDLHVNFGDFLAIMGPSGSGKSTLLNLIGFIDRHYSGQYWLDGEIMTSKNDQQLSKLRNKKVGFVFQGFNLIETLSIKENVELPLLYNGYSPNKTENLVRQALQKVGIEDKINKFPKQLSGGQQQRAAIARAIINEPDFILADEPTGALDTTTSDEIMNVFKQLNEHDKTTIVFVTHDPDTVSFCNRVVHIQDGVLTEQAG